MALIILTVIAFVMQIFIDDTSVNIACDCIALTASLCALAYLRYTDAFVTHPISTFTIFGFCANTHMGSLIVQAATFNSLSKSLRQPLETFSILFLFLLIAIAAHMTYRYFSRPNAAQQAGQSHFSLRYVFEKIGVNAVPTVHQLWLMGLIGLVAFLTSGGGGGAGSHQNVFNKISVGVTLLAWSPFLIPIFVAQIGKQYCNARLHNFFLIGFAGLIALIGIAANTRTIIVSGATTIGLIFLLRGMRSSTVVTAGQIVRVALLLVVAAAMLVPISHLATAMLLARGQRAGSSPVQMFNATIDALGAKQTVIDRVANNEKLAAFSHPYDEYYIENPVLARFVNTKFHDNALYFGSRMSDISNSEMADTSVDMLWAILPDPVLKIFDIKIVKKSLEFSFGDYMYYQVSGTGLGGFRYGSIFAHGIGLFGPFFTVIYFAICLLSFWLLDMLTYINKKGEAVTTVVGILLIWKMFYYGITAESINGTFGFLFRDIPQSIVLFVIIYQVVRLISYPMMLMEQFHPRRSLPGSAK